MPVPASGHNASIWLVPQPGSGLRGGTRYVGTSLAQCCAFIHRHIHGLLFDDWGASVGELRGGRVWAGLAVVWQLGVRTALVGSLRVLLLWEAGVGLGESGLEALNIRLLVHLDSLTACFGQRAITTLVGPQLRGEKCIGGVVVVAIGQCRQTGVVAIYWAWCRGLASGREASSCIVRRVGIDVVEGVCCLRRVAIHGSVEGLLLYIGFHLLFYNC